LLLNLRLLLRRNIAISLAPTDVLMHKYRFTPQNFRAVMHRFYGMPQPSPAVGGDDEPTLLNIWDLGGD
jgi:hypothetical protein